jgi:hypothetical protein
MAFPVRLVFTPFVVVVGGKYFLPVPECLLFDQGLQQARKHLSQVALEWQFCIFYCA